MIKDGSNALAIECFKDHPGQPLQPDPNADRKKGKGGKGGEDGTGGKDGRDGGSSHSPHSEQCGPAPSETQKAWLDSPD